MATAKSPRSACIDVVAKLMAVDKADDTLDPDNPGAWIAKRAARLGSPRSCARCRPRALMCVGALAPRGCWICLTLVHSH